MNYHPQRIAIYGERYFTPNEAAAALNLKVGTIYNLILAGKLRPIRRRGNRRGRIVIPEIDVQQYQLFKGGATNVR